MKGKRHGLRAGGTRHWAMPFVLVMLGLRALVPAGFMLAPIDGGLAIVLCDSDAFGRHPSGGPDHGIPDHALHAHAGHDHAGHHQHTHPDPTCPYAQSSGPAPLPAFPTLAAAPLESTAASFDRVAQTLTRFGPVREHCPRGPPRLA